MWHDIVKYTEIHRYYDGYPGEFIKEEDIKEGFRFYFLSGPDKNIKEWYEVIEVEYDWSRQSYKVAVWDETKEKIRYISKLFIYIHGRVDD